MPYRRAIQPFPVKSPIWREAIHQGEESAVVSGFQEAGYFMRTSSQASFTDTAMFLPDPLYLTIARPRLSRRRVARRHLGA